MIIVDDALRRRARENRPIRVAIVGAGYSGRRIAHRILNTVPGMNVVAIANRTLRHACEAFRFAGVEKTELAGSGGELDNLIASECPAVTEDFQTVTASKNVDVVVEATGTVEYGARVVASALEGGKHVVLMNVELDATVGPVLKEQADAKGLIYSNCDGDEPGAAMNLVRFVRSLGLRPVVAGNLKGLYDPYRNPETQIEFARIWNQRPKAMAHFADGTKLSMEMNVLANATGFTVARRGMHGPKLGHVDDAAEYFADKIIGDGIVDFVLGAKPSNGVFVIAHDTDGVRREYLRYLKMGDGPLYVFYTPYHLPHLEIPNTIARAALFHDAAVAPLGRPVCDSVAIAKTDLACGTALDGMGGFCVYGLLETYETSARLRLLPIGVAEGCRLIRDVQQDQPITYDDVELPRGRLVDKLRLRQDSMAGMFR